MRNDIPISAKPRARAMRREPTEAERKLWYALRDRRIQTLKFRRQSPVGPYIVDFLCAAHRLVVEADGSQHAESKGDAARDAWLARERLYGPAIQQPRHSDGARERSGDDCDVLRSAMVRRGLALTPALSRIARRETGVIRRPLRERGRVPSPACGRRWPEGPDEGSP